MVRAIEMTGKWYGIEIDSINEHEAEEIEGFINQGNIVVLGEDLESVEEYVQDGVILVERVDDEDDY